VRFKIERDLLFLAFVREDRPYEQDESIWRDTIVQLETLLCARDRRQHRQTIDTGLDVGRSAVLLCEQTGHARDLILFARGHIAINPRMRKRS
jgi:hypothetical protein